MEDWTSEELEDIEKFIKLLADGEEVRAIGLMMSMSKETREKLKRQIAEWKKDGTISGKKKA